MSRIIAGSRGGRRISMPDTDKTRPTTDRVREALFSAISSWAGSSAGPVDEALAGLAFCDLFAGSGAVGLEAASRGASPVLLVEADRRTAEVTKANALTLKLPVTIRPERVQLVVQQPVTHPFDVVFLDPPYELVTDDVDAILGALVESSWLAEDSLIVVERSRRSAVPTWPSGFDRGWSKRYGETVLFFGRR